MEGSSTDEVGHMNGGGDTNQYGGTDEGSSGEMIIHLMSRSEDTTSEE